MEKKTVDYAWFVGATGGTGENWHSFSDECIEKGEWINNRTDAKTVNAVKSMKIGDFIVLKSVSHTKHGLPFNNNGLPVGYAYIKALGVILENPGDGRTIKVDWQEKFDPPKRWYTFTGFLRSTVFRVVRNASQPKSELLDFVFNGISQDYSACAKLYADDADDAPVFVEDFEQATFDFGVVSGEMNFEELAAELKMWCTQKENGDSKVAMMVAFGMKYADVLDRLNISSKKLAKAIGSENESAYLGHGRWIAAAAKNGRFGLNLLSKSLNSSVAPDISALPFETSFGYNHIVFGAPGTGKSHALEKEAKKLREAGGYFERVTFHPDYTYASFVGTYKPTPTEGGAITYRFVAGPFIRAYVEAKRDPSRPVLLLIEEINRASVAAVFGDVFQLLDRVEREEDGTVGESKYPVAASEDLRSYLAKVGVTDCETLALPSNLYIFASMNSADQGVYPMDTAFKRRWSFTYIGINDGEEEIGKVTAVADGTLAKEWNAVRHKINDALASFGINEDKQLGPFFLSPAVLTDETRFREAFKSKVLMYLYEDAARHKRDKLFAKSGARYSELCDAFDKDGYAVFASAVCKTGDQG